MNPPAIDLAKTGFHIAARSIYACEAEGELRGLV
jgi:hypothetical protein